MKCVGLLMRGKLLVPKKIALMEIFLFLINPIVFVALFLVSIVSILELLPYSLFFLLLFLLSLSFSRLRTLFFNGVQSYFILLGALGAMILKRKFTVWVAPSERKLLLEDDLLKDKGLI
jgi:hypothetical protein